MVSIRVDEHILLRTYKDDDATALFEVIHANRAHLRPWLDWVDVTTKPEHSVEFIKDARMQEDFQKGMALGIFFNDEIIGGVGMLHWDHQLRKANVGYWIAKDFEGKGIVSKSLRFFLNFLFEKINLHKVEIHFVASNKRSAALAEKLGAKVEGILRDSYIMHGNYADLVVTGILRREWQAKPGNMQP